MKKFISIAIIILVLCTFFTACGDYTTPTQGTSSDKNNTIAIANKLQANQPTPTDIDYSLERYNLIRRAYWVNGMREKANTLPCEVEKPLGYIVLFTESGAVVGSFIVDGKVSSLNSFLTPDSECYEVAGDASSTIYNNGTRENDWLADVDGSYGENDNGIFFFSVQGNYYEWTGTYLYTDVPMIIDEPVIKFEERVNE